MTQQHHYVIDSFDLNEDSAGSQLDQSRLLNRMRRNKSGLRQTSASDALYDTMVIELPHYFTQSKNTNKHIDLQYVHLLQRVQDYNYTKTTNPDGSIEEVTVNTLPTVDTDGAPVTSTVTTTKITDTEGNETTTTTTNISSDPGWTAIPSTMHSDLVQFRPTADNYVCAVNMMYDAGEKVFVIPNEKTTFDVWFRTLGGDIIELLPSKTRVIIELLLTY